MPHSRRTFLRRSAAALAGATLLGESPAAAKTVHIPGSATKADDLLRQLENTGLGADDRLKLQLKLARAYRKQNQFAKETEVLRQVVEAKRLTGFQDQFSRHNFGVALYNTGDFVGASAILETLRGEQSFSMRATSLLFGARSALAANELDQAKAFIDSLRQDFPSSHEGQLALQLAGKLAMKRRRTGEAVQRFGEFQQTEACRGNLAHSNQVAIIDAQIKGSKLDDARAAAQALLSGAGADVETQTRLRHALAVVFWRNARPEEVVEFVEPLDSPLRGASGDARKSAASKAAKSFALAARSYRVLDRKDDAKEALSKARLHAYAPAGAAGQPGQANSAPALRLSRRHALASLRSYGTLRPETILGTSVLKNLIAAVVARTNPPQPDPALIVQYATALQLALQDGDRNEMQAVLAEVGTATMTNPELRERAIMDLGNILQRYGRTDDWRPWAMELAADESADPKKRVHQLRNLARASRLSLDSTQASDWLLAAVDVGGFGGTIDEFDTRMLAAVDCAGANRGEGKTQQMSAAEALAQNAEPALARWFKYRLARTCMKCGDLEDAEARFQSVISQHSGTQEARKSLFALASVAEKQGDIELAINRYSDFMSSAGDDKQYKLQAAVMVLNLASKYPASAPNANVAGLLDNLLVSNPSDWRAVLQGALFLHRHGDKARSLVMLGRALESLEGERAERRVEPFSELWIRQESRVVLSLFDMGRSRAVIQRIDATGIDKYFLAERTQAQTECLYTIIGLYVMALEWFAERDKADEMKVRLSSAFPDVPETLRRRLDLQAVYTVWYRDGYEESIPYAEKFIRAYPRDVNATDLRLRIALKHLEAGNISAAYARLQDGSQGLIHDPFTRFRRLEQDLKYLRGYCLARLGQTEEGEALMAANEPSNWISRSIGNIEWAESGQGE